MSIKQYMNQETRTISKKAFFKLKFRNKKSVQAPKPLIFNNTETPVFTKPETVNEIPAQIPENLDPSDTFLNMGLSPIILRSLERLKFVKPTPIQKKGIPIGLKGKDIVGIAQTGTGKTLAFSLPIIQRLSVLPGKKALIVLPTRELAMQVEDTIKKIAPSFNMRTALLIGGAPRGNQIREIHRNPEIIIGTPGRIIDHLESRILNLKNLEILVLDEADRMFDMGFAPQVNKILRLIPKERQTMLFSATMPEEISKIAVNCMKNPEKIQVASSGTVADKIQQELIYTNNDRKSFILEKILKKYAGTILVFSRTKHGAKRICNSIRVMGHNATDIHSNKSMSQRQEALNGFKKGKYRVLVATDIASRGIDVNDIELIVNYDIPENAEDYVHRIGRTGRAGKMGRAISFATPDQRRKISSIERLTKKRITIINSLS